MSVPNKRLIGLDWQALDSTPPWMELSFDVFLHGDPNLTTHATIERVGPTMDNDQ